MRDKERPRGGEREEVIHAICGAVVQLFVEFYEKREDSWDFDSSQCGLGFAPAIIIVGEQNRLLWRAPTEIS